MARVERPPIRPSGFQPDIFSSSHVTEENIEGDLHLAESSLAGEPLTMLFSDRTGWVGLVRESILALRKAAAGMQRLPAIEPLASEEFLREAIFRWLKATFRGITTGGMVDFVTRAIEDATKPFTVLIPISDLYVESEIVLGAATIRTFPKELFEQIDNSGKHFTGDEAERHRAWYRELREDLQGLATVFTSVLAEITRAKQVAFERAETAVGVLRLFSPAHIDAGFNCYWAPLGHHPRRKQLALFCEPADRLTAMTDEVLGRVGAPVVNAESLKLMHEMGLTAFESILEKPERSRFEDEVLSATIEFGRGALIPELHSRLVIYCAALESILLRDANEPIVQNLAERLAVFLRDSVEQRKEVMSAVREAYSLRSRYVHHGLRSDDREAISRFGRLGMQFFLKVAKNVGPFLTRLAFVEHIDTVKLSGGKA
jgi:hypothetical protein